MIKNFKAYSKLLSRLGLIAVIALIIYLWGAAIVANVANFWNVFAPGRQERFAQDLDTGPVLPPRLNPLPKAVKEPKFAVSGFSQEGLLVTIYLNTQVAGNVRAGKDGRFSFDGLILKEGNNEIYAQAVNDQKVLSALSAKALVKYLKKPPFLEITNLNEGMEIRQKENLFTVLGKTEAGSQVTVNGLIVFVDGHGNFSVQIPLSDGPNTLTAEATNEAGHKSVISRNLTFTR